MSVGQRIAQKRKELGMSQEVLGEQLGVSRQSISKWEGDAAMPEIEKLIAMSRLFSVSVGWLLGVEETQEQDAAAPKPPVVPLFPAVPAISAAGAITPNVKTPESSVTTDLISTAMPAWLSISAWRIPPSGVLTPIRISLSFP